MNGNETARIVEDTVSIWSVYVPVCFVAMCSSMVIVMASIALSPKIRYTKKSYFFTFFIHIIAIAMFIGVFIGGLIFLLTAPLVPDRDYSDCFKGDISSVLSTIPTINRIIDAFFAVEFLILVAVTVLIITHIDLIRYNIIHFLPSQEAVTTCEANIPSA